MSVVCIKYSIGVALVTIYVRIMTVCVTATISQYRRHKHSAVSRAPMWSLITKSTPETKSLEINLFKNRSLFSLINIVIFLNFIELKLCFDKMNIVYFLLSNSSASEY